MSGIIEADRSGIPACDVPFGMYDKILEATHDIGQIGAYKVGVAFLDVGLKNVVTKTREYTKKPIIYDHQKAGTDIHESTPDAFMDAIHRAGVDAVIIFPEAGPVTEYEWIKAAQARNLGVIVGGEMTHPRYLETDLSESKKKDYTTIFREELGIKRDIPGFIREFAPDDMYEIAAKIGVTNFVVPGNKPERIKYYREIIEEKCGITNAHYFSPGFVAQDGKVKDGGDAAGDRFGAIVGRGIYNPNKVPKEELGTVTVDDMRKGALAVTSQL